MACYSLTYIDANGKDHTVLLEAKSGTHAIIVAMERYEELRLHPDRITKVTREDCKK